MCSEIQHNFGLSLTSGTPCSNDNSASGIYTRILHAPLQDQVYALHGMCMSRISNTRISCM